MNCAAEEETTSFYRNPDNNDSESSENFQKFITELFEKNGILNDLRAYLRGHIVGVLKSAGTGALPACQKHFTQRLELVYQALNMLIAEYLLRLEFSYSLSVFVSEIPLANMVFEFARNILKTMDAQVSGLRFDESDVWSIIHYLGIKCDSVHAHKIVDLYKDGESPLLYCFLQCIPMYHKEPTCVENVTSDELSSSVKSAESSDDQPVKRGRNHKCKHHALCTSCQNKLLRLREKYKRRKDAMGKNERRSSVNSLNVHSFMNRISLMEKSVIDEMFQQLKTVYEAEAEIIKEEEQRRVKRSIADHALELQKLREEMEESFKAREAELEKSVHQRKRFLWGLAKALRDQHQNMTRAMREVQHETKRLAEKESSIKMQLEEAEKTLKKRGEEMRNQISQELLTLADHLETMKRERDSINREREELENLRNTYENNSKITKNDTDESLDLKAQYNALKNEVLSMKRERDSINREREEIEKLRETYESKIKIMKENYTDESVDLKTHYNALKDEVLTMKRERDNVNKEREEIENLRNTYENQMKIMKENYTDESVDLKTHYNALKDEMVVLRKYIECAKLEGKSFIERGTVMDLGDGVMMNNSVGVRGDDDDRLKGTQVINDLKKQKNVNFSQSNLDEIYRQLSCSHSGSVHSTAKCIRGSDPDCATDGYNRTSDTVTKSNHGCHVCDGDVMLQLREENDRLKTLARRQRGHIDALSSERQRLRVRLANPPRPRTAPSAMANNYFASSAAAGMNRFGWRTGAGEQVNVFTASEPRVLLPTDAIPFIGVLSDRNTESRRHLISTWRALRPRLSPHTHPRPVAPLQRSSQESADSAELNSSTPSVQPPNVDTICTTPHANIWKRPQKIQTLDKPREKSPKSVLREAKEKLKNNVTKETPPPRDKSPNAVLREAKTRLRKLEIEAEAVEKSYLDFRKRQSELREERQSLALAESSMMKSVKQLELKPSKTLQKVKPTENIASNETFNYEQSTENLKKDFDKYLRQYQTIDLGQIHFHKNSAMQKTKPIPPSYSEICDDNKEPKEENYYLETPLIEFRKLYQTQNKEKRNDASHSKSPIPCPIEKPESDKSTESKNERNVPEAVRQMNIKQAEFEILKENISKIYPETSTPNEIELDISKNTLNSTKTENLETDLPENIQENKLTLQVENVRETNNVGVTESQQDILLVVESSVDNKENDSSENEDEDQKISTQMTIIVSPKGDNDDSPTESKSPRKGSPKTLDKLTNNDALNAILNSDDDKGLFVDMKLELTKDLESDVEKDLKEEYFDDFSADVDNYYNENSISEGGNNSPISLPKTSEDDNFWEN